MRQFLIICFVIVLGLQNVVAEKPKALRKDGIYRISYQGKGTAVDRHDDGRSQIYLGPFLTDDFSDISIGSLSNNNDLATISMKTELPSTRNKDFPYIALSVKNYLFPIASQGRQKDEDPIVQLSARISGKEVTQAVAKTFDVKPELRNHPRHRFTVKWLPEKETYQADEEIKVTLQIKNVGKNTFRFRRGGKQRGPRDNQFSFIAHSGYGHGKAVSDTGDPQNFGGLSTQQQLAPNETFEISVVLNRWFKFTKPDTYRITALYEMSLEKPDEYGEIWQDFAVGHFQIVIEPSETKAKDEIKPS